MSSDYDSTVGSVSNFVTRIPIGFCRLIRFVFPLFDLVKMSRKKFITSILQYSFYEFEWFKYKIEAKFISYSSKIVRKHLLTLKVHITMHKEGTKTIRHNLIYSNAHGYLAQYYYQRVKVQLNALIDWYSNIFHSTALSIRKSISFSDWINLFKHFSVSTLFS